MTEPSTDAFFPTMITVHASERTSDKVGTHLSHFFASNARVLLTKKTPNKMLKKIKNLFIFTLASFFIKLLGWYYLNKIYSYSFH
jgi:hypothetical protein